MTTEFLNEIWKSENLCRKAKVHDDFEEKTVTFDLFDIDSL